MVFRPIFFSYGSDSLDIIYAMFWRQTDRLIASWASSVNFLPTLSTIYLSILLSILTISTFQAYLRSFFSLSK